LPTGLIMPIVPTVPPIIKPNQLRRGNSMWDGLWDSNRSVATQWV
jgi:hypothetical protein